MPGAVTSRDLEAATRLAAHKNLFRKLEDRLIDDHLNQDAAAKRVSLRASPFRRFGQGSAPDQRPMSRPLAIQ
jgi:hypothetical protein